jgi:hypothetical protein
VTKVLERAAARRLRSDQGLPYKLIAAELRVSSATAYAWTSDIEITPEQAERNLRAAGQLRAAKWRARCRQRRVAHQEEGRQRARLREPLHMAGCMLYWAEGTKSRNVLKIANSDPFLLRFFVRFLDECFDLSQDDFVVRVNCYTTPERPIDVVEKYWSTTLGLPPGAFRKPTVNHFPTPSSGKKHGKLPFGVCTVGVKRSTWLVQHVYGAIQEYGGFDEPRWLD